jgi:hypothetical protein
VLPVALTCPLWWVARWATRVLTSLAVLALALGAAPTLPPASTAPASPLAVESLTLAEPGAPSTVALIDRALTGWAAPGGQAATGGQAAAGWAVPGGQTAARQASAGWAAPAQAAAARQASAGWAAAGQADRRVATGRDAFDRVGEERAADVRADDSARSVDPQPALHGDSDALPRPPAGVTSARTGSERFLRAAGSTSRAPRAPPA